MVIRNSAPAAVFGYRERHNLSLETSQLAAARVWFLPCLPLLEELSPHPCRLFRDRVNSILVPEI